MRVAIVAVVLALLSAARASAACLPDVWLHYFGASSKPAVLEPGLGGVHYRVSTVSPQAQRWFDQGFNLLYGFAHEDAIRSFDVGLRYDPKLAMAYWGIAYAYGDNINLGLDVHRGELAWAALHAAERLSVHASPRERGLIDALRARYAGPPCYGTDPAVRPALDRAYYAKMQALHARFPNDEQIATLTAEAGLDLYPWAQWTRKGLPTSPVTLKVVHLLQSVLAKDPNNIGALHFYIHAVEASGHPERALGAAERIKWVAWGQAHLVHAASHIYARTGDWNSAMISGEDALAQDALYAIRTGKPDLYSLAHSNHNRHFQVSVLEMGGRLRASEAAGKDLTAHVAPFVVKVPALEFYLPVEEQMLVRFHQWKKVLAYPSYDLPQSFLVAPALWHYARAMAYFGKHDNGAAMKEVAALDAFVVSIQPRARTYAWNFNKAADILAIASAVAHARAAYARGDLAAAEAGYTHAVALEDHLEYDEPPAWYYPIRESLGAVELKRNEPARAEATFREDLIEYPNNGRSLYGLMLALRREGKPYAATERAFERAWRAADRPLTLDALL